MISKHILLITFLNEPELIFLHTVKVICLHSVLFQTIQFSINTVFYTDLNVKTVLFQTIQFIKSTKLYGFKYCYVSQTIQLNISHLFSSVIYLDSVKCQTILF